MPQFVLAVDPGKRNGASLWTLEGVCLWSAIMSFDELDDWLRAEEHVVEIVYETYRVDHRASRLKGSTNDASQTIGMLRSYAKRKHIDIFRQQNSILGVAALHMGIKLPRGHISDDLAAKLHGWYHLEDRHGFRPGRLRELNTR